MTSILDFDGMEITITRARLVKKTYKGKSSQAALLETSVGEIVSQAKEPMAIANDPSVLPKTVTVKVIDLDNGRRFVKLQSK